MWSSDLVQRALRVAAQAHQGQTVPGTNLPYLLHITQVAAEVMAVAGAPETDCTLAVLCALLHDTLEDTSLTEAELEAEFGPAVLAGVKALTKDDTLPKTERMADSLRRIQAQPPQVAWVKLADRITNLQVPPSHWSAEKIAAYRDEAQKILAALGGSHAGLADRLEAKIATYPPKA
ncbi:HD domain-containing protein [Armatimonas rosea]|uniref:(P)ppGpp synthase/HD superfamily hydrolase n=1 Tax=Armatimonas rosea TaxID=685828 RepID=A0A7W9W7L1_ARMRO|nr:HD domain-containing protein [Armatimonas rosea]MBB6051783.1 (p)ppGpp synthase/HD superfamily hydrolase [Armatimonas rosea]